MADRLPIRIELPEYFLDEEERDGCIVPTKLKKIWAVELDMMCELDRVCKKHGLTYYADSGTLLGAVRHQGYIPWDDDIDLVMLREDYDRLIKDCTGEFQHPYFMQSVYSESSFPRSHAQMRNSLTTAILPHEIQRAGFNQGIFIDIFPLDFDPEKDEEIRRTIKWLNRYRGMLYTRRVGREHISLSRRMRNMILNQLLFSHGEEEALRKIHELCTGGKGRFVDKVAYYSRTEQYRKFPIQYFGEPLYMKFEFMQMPVPKGYDSILTVFYGDYMTPVKEANQHQAFGDVIFDPEVPYQETLKRLREKTEAK